MKRIVLTVGVALAMALWCIPAHADDQSMELEAQSVAEAWLTDIDAGVFGSCWDRAGAMLQENVPREDLVAALNEGREQLGIMEIRSLNRSKVQRDPDGAPAGTYVFLEYAATFERMDKIKECVVLRQEPEAWRVVAYFLK